MQHQIECVEKLKDLKGGAGLMDMGTGKSATSLKIAEALWLTNKINQLLVIAPNGVHKQWALEQIPTWYCCPYTMQLLYGDGGNTKAEAFDDGDGKLHIVVTNINLFSLNSDKLDDVCRWVVSGKTMVILDEATSIKNLSSKRTQRLLYSINSTVKRGKYVLHSEPLTVYRLVLTGTPVTNTPTDIWPLYEFIIPNYFQKNFYFFKMHHCLLIEIENNSGRKVKIPLSEKVWTSIKAMGDWGWAFHRFGLSRDDFELIMKQDEYQGPYKNLPELKRGMEPVSYVKNLEEVTDLKEPLRVRKSLTLSPAQRKAYKEIETKFRTTVNSSTVEVAEEKVEYLQGRAITKQVLNQLARVLRLQQVCSGFIPKGRTGVGVSDKLSDLFMDITGEEQIEEARMDFNPLEVEWIEEVTTKDEQLLLDLETVHKPCIVVTKYSCEADKLRKLIGKQYRCMLWTGWKKEGNLEEFKEGKWDVVVASIGSIAFGFNLQNSHTMLYYSNTFSWERRQQSERRIYRMGQKEACLYVDYVYEDTVEEEILQALKNKQDLAQVFRNDIGGEHGR